MGIWYQDDRGKFHYTDRAEMKKYYECVQELQLWKGEASFFANRGVNYRGIIDKQVFINNEFEQVLERYRPYFYNITSEFIFAKANTELQIHISFVFKDGGIKSYILEMEL